MNEDIRRLIKEKAKYIELEADNDRHSDICKLSNICFLSQEITDLAEPEEERLESIN